MNAGQHFLMQRKQHGGNKLPLTDQQYHDLCVVQMADWLEQVCPSRSLMSNATRKANSSFF